MKLWLLVQAVIGHAIRDCGVSQGVEQVFVAPGNDNMTLDGLDLVKILIRAFPS